MPVYQTACPRNCYSTCTMKVRVADGKLRMIEPDPQNLATPEGVCLKGLSYIERVYSPDRILTPLKRAGANGKFEKIDWESAFEILTGKLNYFRAETNIHQIYYINPACVALCPTDALQLSEFSNSYNQSRVPGFTPSKIRPVIKIIPSHSGQEIPEKDFIPFDLSVLEKFKEVPKRTKNCTALRLSLAVSCIVRDLYLFITKSPGLGFHTFCRDHRPYKLLS